MKLYRKKPIEVEAEQFIILDFNEIPDYTEILGVKYPIKGDGYDSYIEIPTIEGIVRANVSDFIIKGIKSEFYNYTCKEDIFKMTYEKVD